ncbi:MAG: molybdopterin-dependent oxidoreductase [Desulfobacterales bacterium]|nr:molybdopterin-dependent oxidoreductase [Desulfobacterales bacterium]MDD4072558.1 molybdopterin-dependent oxidoreductase [Desulfobacterales bacterium]MDD4393827.1 molybdopterin-dependent oxidoreductase [Desulfobacterales bacterium]
MMTDVTACTLDCPDCCSLLVSVDPSGDIHIRGNPEHPFTAGFTCAKIRHFGKRLKNPLRKVHPMVRVRGRWEPIGWNHALDLCAEHIQRLRNNPLSMLHIQGEGAKGVLKQAGRYFFSQLGTSCVRGSLCDAAGYVATVMDFGSRENNDITDLLNAGYIIIWGRDVLRCSIHTAAIVGQARQNGASVLSISPGDDANSRFADRVITIRPGTDRFLAAAVIRLFLERNVTAPDIGQYAHRWNEFVRFIFSRSMESLIAACDVSQEDIDTIYRYYSDTKPAATLIGTGLQRYRHGGENVRFIDALAFISGHVGRSGGGIYYHLHSLRNLNFAWSRSAKTLSGRILRFPCIGQDIIDAADPPIRMMWVNGSNVINQAPDSHLIGRAFETVQFKVVVDAFMTDTASRADLFLPSTLMLEQEDIVSSYLHNYIQHAKAVVSPPGEARTDFWIFSQVGKRLEPPVILPDAETFFRCALSTDRLSISFEDLKKQNFIKVKRPSVAYAGMKFDHSDGKFRLPARLHSQEPVPDKFRLRLITPVSRDHIHSQILADNHRLPLIVQVSSGCPYLADIDLSKDLYLVSPLQKLKVKLELSDRLHPEAAVLRRGSWMKTGGGVNQLIAARITDIGCGAAYYEQYVRIEN